MNQNIWGPHFWFVLHTITFNYPLRPSETDKRNNLNFLNNLQYILPCSVCRKHYKRHLKTDPPIKKLNSRDEFIKWMIDLHNDVNGETGKRSTYTYQEVLNRYEQIYSMKIITNGDLMEKKKKTFNSLNFYYQILLIIFLVFLFVRIK